MTLDADPARFTEIIESIYDAAADATAWSNVVKNIAQACGGFGGALMLWDTTKNYVPAFHQSGYSDGTWQEYSQNYVGMDPGAAVLREQPDAVLFNDITLGTTEAVKRKHAMYDWLEKVSDQRHAYGARLFTGAEYESLLLIARSGRQGAVAREGMERLSHFIPHLRRSIGLARKFGEKISFDTFDAMPFGIAVLDETGRVCFSNAALAGIVAEHDGIGLTRHGLQLALPAEHAAYRRFVEGIRQRLVFELPSGKVALTASRPSGKRAYSIVASPFPRRNTIAPDFNHTVLICVFDPAYVGHLTEDMLSALFGLTPAEGRLTISLVKYGSLGAAAQQCGLTDGSARQYMKRIFEKTCTGGQVELVALVMGSLRI